MIPFMTEEIYRNLVCSVDASAPESVHLCLWPEVNENLIDKKLEKEQELALFENQKIVDVGMEKEVKK